MSETILIVDDEEDIANLVALNLADEGYETHMVHRGDDALDLAVKLRPDLIVLDLMLPGVDGVEVCRLLRKDPRTTTTSIIMLTARNLPTDRVAGLEAGADDYVDKPFDLDELLARVQGRLRRARQLRQTSPLTGLPGNFEIEHRLDVLIADREPFALLHADLDGFKAYNDHYGFLRGDRAIVLTARVIGWAVADHGTASSFVGHIGGDDFAIVCDPDVARPIAESVVRSFDEQVANLYDPEERDRGYIQVADRSGVVTRYPFLTISIGIASTEVRPITSAAEAAAIAVEMKRFAKSAGGSLWAMDRRRE
ncbi:MAG TPA: response regulator [Acidimicrobiales bacterium]|nr:response regulator [Acidimicrobiales bacterium]